MSKKKPIAKKEKATILAGGEISIPIDWHMPEGLITQFATNMLVQTIEHEFKISFFEIKPFIRLDDSQPLPSKVRADCVAAVIVTADRLPKFIEVLQTQLNKYNSKKQTK